MLSATSTRALGPSTLTSTVFLERRFRMHLMVRSRLCYDSAFAAPARHPTELVHIYASLRGVIETAGQRSTEPRAYALLESELERVTSASRTFRSHGAPAVTVELRLRATDLRRSVGLAHGPLELPAAAWAAYYALAEAPSPRAAAAVIASLAAAGVIAPAVPVSIAHEEPERFARLWSALRPLYAELATGASLKQIAALARISLRQLGRDFSALLDTFGFPGAGFRDATRVLRLRAAALLLSCPTATPSEVARAVGYGSLDAMGRAFRDAGLPPPSVVQEAVRYPELAEI